MTDQHTTRIFLLFLTVIWAIGCSGATNTSKAGGSPSPSKPNSEPIPVSGFEVINTYPHDPKAFTQGLFYHDGFLYESTGQLGSSSLRKVEIETGKVVQKFDLPNDSFAEGAALYNDKVYQLTWQEGICRVFGLDDFKVIKELSYPGEGWGLTTDGTNFFMTDRTHVIRVLDGETFRSKRMIAVMREDGKPLMQINELEYVNGEIWANIWHSEDKSVLGKPNHIARIDPASGKLNGWINLDGLSPDDVRRDEENTLNGIAYDSVNDRIFVTGKNWKKLFEIKVTPPQTK